ncbi:MAG: hypothetical protein CMJ39_08585 [Phycisphaerae bacterium]|nr:hypothetical protein [Phycisphaerae bacterium]|tara:strand:+ start:1127 stop:2416 length:1290 start_codon:yes stop_codon:yes gene_type:complete
MLRFIITPILMIAGTAAASSFPMMTSSMVLGQDQAAAPASTVTVGEEAKKVIDRINAFYRSLPGASTSMSMEIPGMPGMPGMEDMNTSMDVVKPNMFRVESKANMSFVSDGKELWTYSDMGKIWSESPAPADLKAVAKDIGEMMGPGSLLIHLLEGNLLKSQPFMEAASVTAQKGKNPGETELVLKADPANMVFPTVAFGIADGAEPWIKRIRIEMPDTPEARAPGPQAMQFVFKSWKPATAESSNFTWKEPEGWEKVDNVLEHMMKAMAPPMPEGQAEPESEMVGKPAPEFTLDSLEGKSISLESLKGKVVILDFWATWCGPCRKGLPVLMDIAKKRADDGVVLWSVDMREAPEKVKAFLEKSNWDLPVLMDRDGAIGNKYGVSGIPHTVVIGPDGTIVKVEIGFRGEEHTNKIMNGAIDKALGKEGA